jgi:hypothetical protein
MPFASYYAANVVVKRKTDLLVWENHLNNEHNAINND